jgi:hypothetical protein
VAKTTQIIQEMCQRFVDDPVVTIQFNEVQTVGKVTFVQMSVLWGSVKKFILIGPPQVPQGQDPTQGVHPQGDPICPSTLCNRIRINNSSSNNNKQLLSSNATLPPLLIYISCIPTILIRVSLEFRKV